MRLAEYAERLRAEGQAVAINRTVSGRHELAAVTRAIQIENQQVVTFSSVSGSSLPVVSNIYGDHHRLRAMIGATGTFCSRWNEMLRRPPLPDYCRLHSAADDDFVECQLSDLPLITYHAEDAGPYFTSAIFLAKEPDTGCPNLSFHRSMYVNDQELRIRLGSSHDLARYQKKAEERGQPLEAAILIGTPPEVFLAACAWLPYDADEIELASRLAGAPMDLLPCFTIDIAFPRETEIIIEGEILPNVRRPEGPFGEFMGNYVAQGDNHVFRVKKVRRRRDAVFHALICGSDEDLRPLEALTAARVYNHVSSIVQGVVDVSCKPNVLISIIKIRKSYEGHGQHALLAALGSNMDYNKVCIVVDEDVDIYNLDDVMWAYLTRGRADTRAQIIRDIPGFYRDPHKDHWGRLAIDATMPWGREQEFRRKAIPGLAGLDLAKYISS